jgi:hypothetical protein
MGAAQPIIDAPQSQFRVRFTRARGFASLFERPENTYHWSGYGTLHVGPNGVQFQATRRRLIGLSRAEAHFVPGREISNVYREADGVRVEFREDARQTYLNFWAEDSAAAASIVEQLPTARTVEVEDAPRTLSRPPKSALRIDLVGVLILALIIVAIGTWVGLRRIHRDGVPVPAAQAQAMEVAAPAASVASGEQKVLQTDLARFAGRSGALRAQFDSAFKALQDGSLTQQDFADGIERWLIPQWVSQEKALREATYAAGSRREELRAALIGVSSNWRNGLETYAHGLRLQDPALVHRAFAYIGAGEESEREAQELLER